MSQIFRGRRVIQSAGALVAAAGLIVGMLSACSPTPGASTSPSEQTLRVGVAGGSTGSILDPHVLTDAFNVSFAWSFYETLGAFDENNVYRNVLVDSFTPNSDATSWTAVVKDGVTFQDGRQLTADDIAFSFNRILDPATGATLFGTLSSVVSSVTPEDEKTVRFDLVGPFAELPQLLSTGGSMGIVPTDFDVNQPVSTGPWTFEGYEPGVSATLSRYDGYHGTPALTANLDLIALLDDNARANALATDQIDIDTYLTTAGEARFVNDPAFQVLELPSSQFEVITMRVDQGPFADTRVREAMKLAVDREQILSVVSGGHGRVAYDVYGIDDPAFRDDLTRPRDVERAKQLIAESGVGNDEIVLETIQSQAPMAQIVASNAREIGLNVTVNVLEDALFFSEGYLERDFATDIFPGGSIVYTAGTMEGPAATINGAHFSDAEFNEQYVIATTSLDESARAAAISRMQEITFEKGGVIIPRFTTALVAAKSNVAGLPSADPAGNLLYSGLKDVSFTS